MEKKKEVPAKNQQKTRLGLLILFTLGALAIGLIGEAFKTHLIWYIRFSDFIDLLIVAPLSLLCLALLHEHFQEKNVPRWLRRGFLLLAMLYVYGHAMHMTSNTINTFSTEIRDYGPLLPQDMSELVYYLDEKLSHWILFLSRYGLLACLLVLEARYLSSLISGWVHRLAVGSGVLYGIADAVVFVEGQTVYLLPIVLVGLGSLCIGLWKSSDFDFTSFWRAGPVITFVTVLLPSMVIGLGAYVWIAGGFKQFSELNLLG